MVQRVLEHTGYRAVVFGGDENHGVHSAQLAFQPLYLGSLGLVVVLVVQRQVADAQLLEGEIGGSEPDQGIGQFAIDGFLAKAADDITDLLGHSSLLSCQRSSQKSR